MLDFMYIYIYRLCLCVKSQYRWWLRKLGYSFAVSSLQRASSCREPSGDSSSHCPCRPATPRNACFANNRYAGVAGPMWPFHFYNAILVIKTLLYITYLKILINVILHHNITIIHSYGLLFLLLDISHNQTKRGGFPRFGNYTHIYILPQSRKSKSFLDSGNKERYVA